MRLRTKDSQSHAIEELSAGGGAPARSQTRGWVALAFVLHALLMSPFLILYGPAWFLHLGREFEPALDFARDKLGNDVAVPHVVGHDGKSFWVLAHDPLLTEGERVARLLDRPAYRAQRIAYPLVTWPWSLAGEQILLWGMIISNLGAVVVGAWVACRLARDLRAPPRACLAFTLCPAVVVSVLFDLPDALSLTALLLTLYLLLRSKYSWAIGTASVATLARESSLLVLVAVALLWRKAPRKSRLLLVVIPGLLGAAWGLYSRWRLGWPSDGSVEFAVPFSSYLELARGAADSGLWTSTVVALSLLLLAAWLAARWWRRRTLMLIAALPTALLVPVLSLIVIDVPLNSLRTVGPGLTFLIMDLYSDFETEEREAVRD